MATTAFRIGRFIGSAVLVGSTLLAACGGGSSTPAATTLSGTAAVGAPIVGGVVTVNCAGGSVLTSAPTSSTGGWTVTINGQTLPCATQVTGGKIGVGGLDNTIPYHSIAVSFGTVNITPLTDLVVAQLTGSDPATWFGNPAFSTVKADAIATALTTVKTNLGLGTLDIDPITATFSATTGDKMDNHLEALKTTLATYAGKDYSKLLAALYGGTFTVDFSGFGTTLASVYVAPSTGGSSTSGETSCNTSQLLMVYDGTGKYTKSQGVCFTATSTSLSFSGKTLTSPVQNTVVSSPYSAYKFTDASDAYVYEVIFNADALYEINVSKGSGADDYVGQFAPSTGTSVTGAGTGTLTIDTTVVGVTTSIVVSGVTKPSTESEFCSFARDDKSTTALNATGGSLTINSCTYSGGIGTIAATVAVTTPISFSTSYTIKYTYN